MDYDALCRSPRRCWGHEDCLEHPELGAICGEHPLEFYPGYGPDDERFVSPDVVGSVRRLGQPRGDGDFNYAADIYNSPTLHEGERTSWPEYGRDDGDGEHPAMCWMREGGGDRFWDNLLDDEARPLSAGELTDAVRATETP